MTLNKRLKFWPFKPMRKHAPKHTIGKAEAAKLMQRFAHTHQQSLPILAEQLTSVNTDIETTVSSLITDFLSLADKTSQQGEELLSVGSKVSTVEVRGEDVPTEALLSNVRNLLNEIIEQLVWISEKMMHVTFQIEDLQENSKNINGLMRQVDNISEKTNLLALNASIEAARAGEHGKGFMVVAEEVRKLAQQSNQFSETIQKDMANIAGGLGTCFSSISEVVTKDMTPLLTHKATIESMVSKLLTQKEAVATQLQAAGTHSKTIATTIFGIVEKLQFQDRTRQRIEHVTAPLGTITAELAEMLENQGWQNSPHLCDHQFLEELKNTYTMAAERSVHTTGGAHTASEDQKNDDNIDLF